MALKKQIIGNGENLLRLFEIIPAVPVYLKIPIRKLTAPLHISFCYFKSKIDTVIPSTEVDVTIYLSLTEKQPDRAFKSGEHKPGAIIVK